MSDTLDTIASQAEQRVLQSLTVKAAPCPVHTNIPVCDCQAALSNMSSDSCIWYGRIYYCMAFEISLLSRPHAWTYTNDKPSHDAFVAAEDGQTPKHFVRDFLQRDMFVKPATRLDSTVQATLDLWIARNERWHAKYGTREVAQEKWIQDQYPDAPLMRTRSLGENEDRDVRVGDIMQEHVQTPCEVVGVKTADGEHYCNVWMTKLRDTDREGVTPYGVCVRRFESCHDECDVAREIFEMNLEELAGMALEKLEAREDEVTTSIRRVARSSES